MPVPIRGLHIGSGHIACRCICFCVDYHIIKYPNDCALGYLEKKKMFSAIIPIHRPINIVNGI